MLQTADTWRYMIERSTSIIKNITYYWRALLYESNVTQQNEVSKNFVEQFPMRGRRKHTYFLLLISLYLF